MAEQDKSVADLAAEIKAMHAEAIDKVKAIAEDALGKAKAGETLGQKAKGDADEALTKMNELQATVDTLAQKLARGGPDAQAERTKSLGEQLVESDAFKSFAESGFSRSTKADFRTKATLTTLTTDAAGSVGDGMVDFGTPLADGVRVGCAYGRK